MLQAVVVDSQAIFESSFKKWCFWFQLPDFFARKKRNYQPIPTMPPNLIDPHSSFIFLLNTRLLSEIKKLPCKRSILKFSILMDKIENAVCELTAIIIEIFFV